MVVSGFCFADEHYKIDKSGRQYFINIKNELKMDNKNIVTVILIIVVIVLAAVSYYFYSGAVKCKTTAIDLGAKLQECGAGVDQLKAGLAECTTQATQCQEALTSLQQMCAPLLPTQ